MHIEDPGASQGPSTVLVVSPRRTRTTLVTALFAPQLGLAPAVAPDLDAAERLLDALRPDCLLVDRTLGEGRVLDFVERRARSDERQPTIVFGGPADDRFSEAVRRQGALDVLEPTVDLRLLERSVRLALERRRFDRLRRGLARAQRLQALGQLTAMLLHDLAAPLTVFDATAALLDEHADELSEDLLAMTPILQLTVDHLLHLVGTVKEQGRLAVDWQTVDLAHVVDDAARLAGSYVRRHARLEVSVVSGTPVRAERAVLVQLVVNLLTNAAHAVRDGPGSGCVRVAAYVDEGRATIEVVDDGVGIPGDRLSRIFEPWYTRQRGGGGTGLGLRVAREQAHRHGGTISVRSEPGKGSTFRLTLPLVSPA